MSNLHKGKINIRKSFGKIKDIVPVPNLIEIQSSSFNDFVQLDYLSDERKSIGLEKVLRGIFPIEHEDRMSLEYVSYELGNWSCTCGKLTGIENRYKWINSVTKKTGCSRLTDEQKKTARYITCPNCLSRVAIKLPLSLDECRSSGQTFSMPLKIKIQLITWAIDEQGAKLIQDVKEQDIFFADIPIMADLYEEHDRCKLGNLGTFLINGVDRVIVSQLHRSAGVVFSKSKRVKDFRGRPYYLARIIPMRGSWIDFEFDSNDHLYVRIDKKKKLLVTTFLQALGIPRDKIVSLFYKFETVYVEKGHFYRNVDDSLLGQRLERGMLPEKKEKTFIGKRVTKEIITKLKKAGITQLDLKKTSLLNRVFGKDVIDESTGEILVEQGQTLTEELYERFTKQKKLSFDLIRSSGYVFQPTIAMTLTQDRCMTLDEALKELHSKVWPGDSSSIKEVKERLENSLYNSRFYDLTRVGRIRMNRKLNLSVSEETISLTEEDIIATIRYLVNLRERGEGELDDIDH